MFGWGLLGFSTVGMVAYYFWKQERDAKAGRSHDHSGGDTSGNLAMSDFSAKDFSWAPGHHHDGSAGGGGHHHGGASGDFSGGGDGGSSGGDSGSF